MLLAHPGLGPSPPCLPLAPSALIDHVAIGNVASAGSGTDSSGWEHLHRVALICCLNANRVRMWRANELSGPAVCVSVCVCVCSCVRVCVLQKPKHVQEEADVRNEASDLALGRQLKEVARTHCVRACVRACVRVHAHASALRSAACAQLMCG